MRYICYSWFSLISSSRFRKLQNEIHEEKQELMIQCSSGNPVCRTYLLVMEEEGADFQLTHLRLNQKGRIRASCNGFIVVNDPKNVKLLHVMNLVTKKSVTLPPCGSGCRHSRCGIALAFNSSTQEYKVVHIYVDGYGIEIYTLGCSESAWNRIPGPFHGREHERPNNNSRIEWTDPVTIKERFLHWNIGVNEYFISMDINDEKSVRTYAPELGELKLDEDGYLLLELGGYLSLMCTDPEGQMVSVWILEDFHKQVWFKKCNIVAGGTLSYINLKDSPPFPHKFDGRPPNLANLVPVATFWCGKVIVFRPKKKIDDRLYVYNIRQNFMRKIRIKTSLKSGEKFITHKSSLLSWEKEGV